MDPREPPVGQGDPGEEPAAGSPAPQRHREGTRIGAGEQATPEVPVDAAHEREVAPRERRAPATEADRDPHARGLSRGEPGDERAEDLEGGLGRVVVVQQPVVALEVRRAGVVVAQVEQRRSLTL